MLLTEQQIEKLETLYNKNKALLTEIQTAEANATPTRKGATLYALITNTHRIMRNLNADSLEQTPARGENLLPKNPAEALKELVKRVQERISAYAQFNGLSDKTKYEHCVAFFKEVELIVNTPLAQQNQRQQANPGASPINNQRQSSPPANFNQSRFVQPINQSRFEQQPPSQDNGNNNAAAYKNSSAENQVNRNNNNNRQNNLPEPNIEPEIEQTALSTKKENDDWRDLVFRFKDQAHRNAFVRRLRNAGVNVYKDNIGEQGFRGIGIFDDTPQSQRSLYIRLRPDDQKLLVNSKDVDKAVPLINALVEPHNQIQGKPGTWNIPNSLNTQKTNGLQQNANGEIVAANAPVTIINNYNNTKSAVAVGLGAAVTGAGVGATVAKSTGLFTLVAGAGLFASPLIAKMVAIAAVAAVVLAPAIVAGLGAYGLYKGYTNYKNKKNQETQNNPGSNLVPNQPK